MKSKFLTKLWLTVLNVDYTNYFTTVSEVENAYEAGNLEYGEYMEMKKQLDKYFNLFMGEISV